MILTKKLGIGAGFAAGAVAVIAVVGNGVAFAQATHAQKSAVIHTLTPKAGADVADGPKSGPAVDLPGGLNVQSGPNIQSGSNIQSGGIDTSSAAAGA